MANLRGPKMVSAEEAVAVVRSGQRVFVQGAAAVPRVLLAALARRGPELSNVEVMSMHLEGEAPHVAPELARSFRHRALFIGANVREAVNAGRADYVPIFLSDIPALMQNSLRPDVALINVSPPDAHGYCSLGTSVDCTRAAVHTASTVIAQINPSMPRTLGGSFIRYDQIHLAVEVDEPPIEVPPAPVGEVERRIGRHVASLVEDGATLQLGIGAIPNAVLAELSDRRDLGVHSEMVSDGIVELVECGAVTGACKTIDRGIVVAAFVVGTRRLYRYVHDNPGFEMHPLDYTNDTSVIRRNPKVVAINSAIEVDLTGQVAADSIGFTLYSGVGGQMDFVRGAALSPGGKPIIALPSTARNGQVSRIVPLLRPGAAVVTTRAHLHYVVTEHGVAELHGRSLRERAAALIRIADPAFRDDLTAFAREHHYL